MSVWPPTPTAPLAGAGGVLVSVSIDVEARDLESLLEALARVSFPVNPQIYHEAAMIYVYPDGRQETRPVTLVEFPAYSGQLEELRAALAAFGFDPERAQVNDMLSDIHAELQAETPPPGADYAVRYRRKRRVSAAG